MMTATMSTTMDKNSSLQVTTASHHPDFQNISKLVEIRNENYEIVATKWISGLSYKSPALEPGVYVVSISLSSGDKKEKVVELQPNEDKPVQIDFSGISPRETQEWAYLAKNMGRAVNKSKSLINEIIIGSPVAQIDNIEAKKWEFINSSWQVSGVQIPNQIGPEGESFVLDIDQSMQVLQVGGGGIPWICVCLPPSPRLRCLIKPSEGPVDAVHPLDITVSTENWKAESLLALLTSGSINRAKSLMKIEQAERLLYDKVADPAAAAIGGYYLLKMSALEQMHDWANNLANWFQWMPDGAIIHAWQLLKKADSKQEVVDKKVRERFLQAIQRGIPIYTEGLRLLYDGLKLLSYSSSDSDAMDNAIKDALKHMQAYVQAVDWSQETTTFIAVSPDQPGTGK